MQKKRKKMREYRRALIPDVKMPPKNIHKVSGDNSLKVSYL